MMGQGVQAQQSGTTPIAETIKDDQEMYQRVQWGAGINLALPLQWYVFGQNRLAADFIVDGDLFTLCCESREDGTYHISGLFEDMPAEYYLGRSEATDAEFIGI